MSDKTPGDGVRTRLATSDVTFSSQNAARKGRFPSGVWVVLIITTLHYFGFYAVSSSLATYLKRAGLPFQMAQSLSSLFGVLSYMLCLVVAVLSDSYLGPFMSLGTASLVYLVGAILVAVAGAAGSASWLCLTGIVLVAIGQAAMSVTLPIIAVAQLKVSADGRKMRLENLFWYRYWFLNVGGAFATYMCGSIAADKVSLDSFSAGAAAIFLAFLLFWAGSCCFSGRFAHRGSRVFRPLVASLWHSARRSKRGRMAVVGWMLLLLCVPMLVVATMMSGWRILQAITAGMLALNVLCLVVGHWSGDHVIEVPSAQLTLVNPDECLSVQEARLTFQTVPTLLLVTFPIMVAYELVFDFGVMQVCQSDVRLPWDHSRQISGMLWIVLDSVVILVCMPFVLRVCRRFKLTLTMKFAIAYFCALAALVSLACLETARKSSDLLRPKVPQQDLDSGLWLCVEEGVNYCSSCAPSKTDQDGQLYGIYMRELNAGYFAIPFTLLGIAEMFSQPTTLYFACAYAPQKTRTMLLALWLIVDNVYSAILGTLLQNLGWAGDDLSAGYVEGYYYFGIGLLAFFLLFLGYRHHDRAVHPTGRPEAAFGSRHTTASEITTARVSTFDKSLSLRLTQQASGEELSPRSLGESAVGGASERSLPSKLACGALHEVGASTEDVAA